MNIYDGILGFNGTFRTYQQRVLDNAADYLSDGRVHIVAAPGSGKTTLGIELIRQLGKPALILSPRLVIRDQWIGRIEEAFLRQKTPGLLSTDLRKPGVITSVTYQTLYCASVRYKGVEEDAADPTDEAAPSETVDFSGFDLYRTVKNAGIGVLCLDECHHLRSEWWKALEDLTASLREEGVLVIALTATPPFDAAPKEWERYTALCGPVDEEISVPELVADNCLCPHQDYVMFSCPTREERARVADYENNLRQAVAQLTTDDTLIRAVAGHAGLTNYKNSHESMLDDPAYLSSLLIFLQGTGQSFDPRWTALLGTEELPPLTAPWLERVLQGFLYDDAESFPCPEGYRDSLETYLRRHGLIQRKKVVLTDSEELRRLLTGSLSKLDSIRRITEAEYANLGSRLRLLILTDYIRAEYLTRLGTDDTPDTIGVIPIFELLRRSLPSACRLSVLCGSVVVLPESALPSLRALAAEAGFAEEAVTASPLSAPDGSALGYARVSIQGKNSEIIGLVTELFQRGVIQVVIGTKSLLGEGYDAPCVNALILASFVGSYVLCNQMRGRAIRVQRDDPEKTANIWHLVCIDEPENALLSSGLESSDFELLQRRMDAFTGVSYDGKYIENGIDRLSFIQRPFTEKRIAAMNEKTLDLSARRELLRQQWLDAVEHSSGGELTVEYVADDRYLRSTVRIRDVLGPLLLFFAADLLILTLGGSILPKFTNRVSLVRWGFAAVLTFFVLKYGYQLIGRLSPVRYLRGVGDGVLQTLKKLGDITSDCHVTTDAAGAEHFVSLAGGTSREKELFAQCVAEFFSPVENQRYLLRRRGVFEFFCVPDRFARRREDAQLFADSVSGLIGPCELVYTRNPEGRQVLLQARMRSWANLSQGVSETLSGKRRKRVKQELI